MNHIIVSILNNPIISISSTNDTICVGEVVNLSATGAVSHVWSPASSLNVTTGSTVSAMPTMTTNYSVTGISSENCITTLNKSISVNPLPSLSINSNSFIICEDSSISLLLLGHKIIYGLLQLLLMSILVLQSLQVQLFQLYIL